MPISEPDAMAAEAYANDTRNDDRYRTHAGPILDDSESWRTLATWADPNVGTEAKLVIDGHDLTLRHRAPGGEDYRDDGGMVAVSLEGHADKLLFPLLASLDRDNYAMFMSGRLRRDHSIEVSLRIKVAREQIEWVLGRLSVDDNEGNEPEPF